MVARGDRLDGAPRSVPNPRTQLMRYESVRLLLISLAACVAIAVLVFVATGGKVIFLPLILLLPLAFVSLGRRER